MKINIIAWSVLVELQVKGDKAVGQLVMHVSALLSFGMAYDFIDCVGDDVDVVSDSEVCIMHNIIIYTVCICC